MSEKTLLKDHVFNPEKIKKIAHEIQAVYPPFDANTFWEDVITDFPALELKARIAAIAEHLHSHLPQDFREAVTVLRNALPPAIDPNAHDGNFGDFIYAPYSEFIARYGCTREHLWFSLQAIHEITRRFSAEYAIRRFINAFPDETLQILLQWSQDDSCHVRRLCSEGTRPKLPWGQGIIIPVEAAIPLLDQLYADSTRYVTRSVANHVNDISKIAPDLAVAVLAKWQSAEKQTPGEMDWMMRHALRSSVKKGNPAALAMLGFRADPPVHVSTFSVPQRLSLSEPLTFSVTLEAQADTNLMVDYLMFFQSKTGKKMNQKVFKLKNCFLKKGEHILLSKVHRLTPFASTRKIYPGEHHLQIQINGTLFAKKSFVIECN